MEGLAEMNVEQRTWLRELRATVDRQTQDSGLWFKAKYATELTLQRELRLLAIRIERFPDDTFPLDKEPQKWPPANGSRSLQ